MKKFYFINSLIILFVLLFSSITYAYYVTIEKSSDFIIETGNLDYDITEESCTNKFIDKTGSFIVPGEELIKTGETIYITNKSSISSQVRIKISVQVNSDVYYVDDNNTNEIIATISDEWIFSSTDECWYYGGEEVIVEAVTDINPSVDIDILSAIKLNGNYFGNAVSSQNVVITITYQAKQAEYVDWLNIGEFSVNLGI